MMRMARAKGVLPDDVIRDHRSSAVLVLLRLRPELDQPLFVAFLEQLTAAVHAVTRPVRGERSSRVAVGFGPSLLTGGRFGIAPEAVPAGFRETAAIPGLADAVSGQADLLLYTMVTSEAVATRLLRQLAAMAAVMSISVERGFQSEDVRPRELGGFRDGLRNLSAEQRSNLIFIDRDDLPEEPAWCEDGTYMAYIKIQQNLDAWTGLPVDVREAVIGRRLQDGSRLDLAPGTDARSEGPFQGDPPAPNSHVRKSGPRSGPNDRVGIFRRGVPWVSVREPEGRLEGGLQFVSFQRSLDAFITILDRWMLNLNFPHAGAGGDRLLAEGFATMLKGGCYFVPPHFDDRHLAAGLFEPVHPPGRTRERTGRIAIRKTVVDSGGIRQKAELGGAVFQAFRQDTGAAEGETFETDSAGHALSGELPTGTPLIIREIQPPAGQQAAQEQPSTIEHRRELLRFQNVVVSASPGYG
jgi:Dyp-type peroxidase family